MPRKSSVVHISKSRSKSPRRVLLPLTLGIGSYLLLRPYLRTAGARPEEIRRTLPGDATFAFANFQATRATDLAAPPSAVWPWIAQLGRDRSGFYGLDGLTNGGIPSVAYLRQDLPTPEADMPMDHGYRILAVEPGRYLLYGRFNLPTIGSNPMESTTLLLLETNPRSGTRLISRTRAYAYGLLAPLYLNYYEVIDYLQTREQFKNIEQRVETLARLSKPAHV